MHVPILEEDKQYLFIFNCDNFFTEHEEIQECLSNYESEGYNLCQYMFAPYPTRYYDKPNLHVSHPKEIADFILNAAIYVNIQRKCMFLIKMADIV